jgi:hypothetical protein
VCRRDHEATARKNPGDGIPGRAGDRDRFEYVSVGCAKDGPGVSFFGGDRELGSWGETRLREFRRTLGERVLSPLFQSTCDFDRRLVRNPGKMRGGCRRRSGRRDSCGGLAGVGWRWGRSWGMRASGTPVLGEAPSHDGVAVGARGWGGNWRDGREMGGGMGDRLYVT